MMENKSQFRAGPGAKPFGPQQQTPAAVWDVVSLFSQALAFHRGGRLEDAERNYLQILKAQSDHLDSLHLLGVIYFQRGNHAAAVRQIDAALKLNPNVAPAHNNRGNALQGLGRPDEALESYDRAIALEPDYADAFNNRGNALQQLKRPDEAVASYDKALGLRPDYAEAFNNRGNALQQLKRFEEALESYARTLALRPDYVEALINRGNALQQLERFDEALASYDQALALRPDIAEAFNNRGNALQQLERFDEALSSYDEALALRPDHAEAFINRGNALQKLERFDEALASYDRAIALKPDTAEAFNGRGAVLQKLERLDEALVGYDKALALRPAYAEAFNNRGAALKELERLEEALASYDEAIALKPDYAEAYNNRGNALAKLKRLDEALASYDKAIALKPDYAEAFNNRGNVLNDQGKAEEAMAQFGRALALKPDYPEAEFAMCMAELPILYMNEPEIVARRMAYERRLRALCEAGDRSTNLARFAKGVGHSQPFYLPYQGYNDRDLQALYGSFVCRVMAERYPPVAPAPSPGAGEPLRLGFVSGFFRQHSNWKLPIKGWLRQLDRRRFRMFGYHTGFLTDAETDVAMTLCDRFVQGPLSIDRWRAEILADAPHVLIYPEIGMDRVATVLATQRLAAVQCNSWGHPTTSGFPTLDYYLGSDLMEPPDGQNHYTERLVRLPNLSVYCEPIDRPPVALVPPDLGLRATGTLYWCGQSLFKFLPRFDEVFARIAGAVGDCQFVFIQHQEGSNVTGLFRRRLDRAFAALGLRTDDYCIFLPRLDQRDFLAATGQCHVFLDSIGWSGCNSTLESLLYDLPIVTMAGPLMRGRHSMAILTMMGVTDTIAETIDDYVSIAVRLARDMPWRLALKARISAGKHRIYFDRACITGLEQFLNRVARRNAP
jgi:protein O-GlcNAc transferase